MNTEEAATVLQIASTLDESEDKNLMTVATILRGMLGEIQRLGTESDKLRADLAARDAEIAKMQEQFRDYVERSESDAIDLRKEIADLKWGGVDAAELDAISDAIRCIGNDAHHASTGPAVPDALWDIRSRAYDVCARIDGIRTIPADRVLGEGEARIGMNELQMLRGFAGRRMSEREYDRLEAVRDAHEDALRAQPTQEAAK